ncbi:MAG TPA: hypothetical protein PLB66_05040 [Bacteroidales bacterium]|nr:hypothetical protein [Bacteroidales bacterium]
MVFVVCFYPSGDCQYFNFKIFHFVVKDIPVQIWYKLPDISSGNVVSAQMKKRDTSFGPCTTYLLGFPDTTSPESNKKRVLKDIQYPFEIGDL